MGPADLGPLGSGVDAAPAAPAARPRRRSSRWRGGRARCPPCGPGRTRRGSGHGRGREAGRALSRRCAATTTIDRTAREPASQALLEGEVRQSKPSSISADGPNSTATSMSLVCSSNSGPVAEPRGPNGSPRAARKGPRSAGSAAVTDRVHGDLLAVILPDPGLRRPRPRVLSGHRSTIGDVLVTDLGASVSTAATRPVVLLAEKLAPSAVALLGDDVEIRHVDGTDRPALLAALADADALLVRSATKVDAEALAASTRLKVVARAGVGLDNVDVPAATARGVMVVNAPTSNIVSAAEHAIALLLSAARHIPAADASLRQGQWKRSSFTGVELSGKTVGIVGLGKIGQLVAQRLAVVRRRPRRLRPLHLARPRRAARHRAAHARRSARSRRHHLHPPAEDPRDGRPDRQGPARAHQAGRDRRQRRARRPHRRGRAGRGRALRARRRGGHRRLRHRAHHREPAVRAGARGRHAAPRRVHRRGAGPGGHRRGPLGAARARR